MVDNKPGAKIGEEQITGVHDPVLAKCTNRFYRGFDLSYPDMERAKVFLAEFHRIRTKRGDAAAGRDAPG